MMIGVLTNEFVSIFLIDSPWHVSCCVSIILSHTNFISHQYYLKYYTELFTHNSMVHEFYRGDPLDVNTNTGVFGRMLDKLKLQGYQTSANSRGAGDQMLAGDQKYKNPIWGVSTSAPSDLNQDPTVLDIYEVVKELNGVGTPTSGVMSETWSSRVAAALFEHEQMKLIATMDEFDVETYGEGDLADADGGSSLGSSFKAIIEYMKSRHFRKVNHEVYVPMTKMLFQICSLKQMMLLRTLYLN